MKLCSRKVIEFTFVLIYTDNNGIDRVFFGPVARLLN